MEKLLFKFVKENFGKHFTVAPVLESGSIKLLSLAGETTRAWWKRPFGPSEKFIIGNLRDFVKSTKEQDFLDSSVSNAVSITPDLSKTAEGTSLKNQGMKFSVLGEATIELKHSQILGDLQLGKLTGESITDKELRKILDNVELDQSWVKEYDFRNRCLYIITAVVYSEKLQVVGEPFEESVVKVNLSLPEVLNACLGLTEGIDLENHFSDRMFSMVRREMRAPLLFKFFKVKYDSKTNKLCIAKNVLTGSPFREDRTVQAQDDEEKYDVIDFVKVNGDQSCHFQEFFPSQTLPSALVLLGRLFDGVKDVFEINIIADRVFTNVEKLICSHEKKTSAFLFGDRMTNFFKAAGCNIQNCDVDDEDGNCVVSIEPENSIEPLQEAALILKEMQSLEEKDWILMKNILKGHN